MTAYSSRYQLEEGRIFAYSSDQPTYTFEEPVHEAIYEETQCLSTYQTSLNSPDQSPKHTLFSDDTNCRIRDESDNNYGLHYYYGKLWNSSGEQLTVGCTPKTTSSPVWTPEAPRAFHALPSDIPHTVSSRQIIGAPVSQTPHDGGVYPAQHINKTTPHNGPTMTPLPSTVARLPHNPNGFILYRRVPSPRTIRSFKINTSVVAHQKVPPEKISSYSELSPNIEFMERLKLEETYSPIQTAASMSPQPPISTTLERPRVDTSTAASSAVGMGLDTSTDTTPLPSGSNATPPTSAVVYQTSIAELPPKKRRRKRNTIHESVPERDETAPSTSSTSPEESLSKNPDVRYMKPEARKPSLACTFCRERKISCGRPPPGSADPTCNQCARRSFKCTYLTDLNAPKSGSSRRRS